MLTIFTLHSIVRLRHSGSVLLDLVDLAGSEEHGVPITASPGENQELFRQRQRRDSSLSEQEASAINLGLLGLRQVFERLKKGKEPMYRDTKLTLALRDTLGLFLFPLLFLCAQHQPTRRTLARSPWVQVSPDPQRGL